MALLKYRYVSEVGRWPTGRTLLSYHLFLFSKQLFVVVMSESES